MINRVFGYAIVFLVMVALMTAAAAVVGGAGVQP